MAMVAATAITPANTAGSRTALALRPDTAGSLADFEWGGPRVPSGPVGSQP
jgi:hypothetical protein